MKLFMKKVVLAAALLAAAAASACGGGASAREEPADTAGAPAVEEVETAPPVSGALEEILFGEHVPAGVFVSADEGASLTLYDPDGMQIAGLLTPGSVFTDPENVHIAGNLPEDESPPPVVYRSWEPDQALMLSEDGAVNKLRDTHSFLALAGAAGKPVLSFSEMTVENNAPRSFLFAAALDTIGTAAPVLELSDDLTGMALKPVGVEASGGEAQGVWYTKTAWGIGGVDLMFHINRGLFFYDINSGENTPVIGEDRNFQGISPDHTFAASVEFDIGGDKSVMIHDLEDDQTLNFPLNPSSDRGAGFVVFSPDSRLAAWLEGEGSIAAQPPNFTARVRAGEISSGGVIQEKDHSAAAALLGWERVSLMKPVGWLDNQSVLIEARGEDWAQVSLLRLNAKTGEMEIFCPGSFAGFVYP